MSIKAFLFVILSAAGLSSSAQLDSNKVFLQAKGCWQYPILNTQKVKDLSKSRWGCTEGIGTQFISTKPCKAYAVTEGKVIVAVVGDSIGIIITKFGDYIVTYVGLSDVSIKKNDIIRQGQEIGTVQKVTNEDSYIIEIRLWETSKKEVLLAPNDWFQTAPKCKAGHLFGLDKQL